MRDASRVLLLQLACATAAMIACGPVRDSLVDDESDGGRIADKDADGGTRRETASPSDAATSSSDAATSSSDAATSSSSGEPEPPLDPSDPFAAGRARCVNKINELRATKDLAPYGTWSGVEACVDAQATSDQSTGSPHAAWSQDGVCRGSAQNECLGGGVDGIESCLDMMWNEKLDPACTGCDACAGSPQGQNCPDCTFGVCGHYVNMSAQYLSEVACGFSTAGSGGWAVQNFH